MDDGVGIMWGSGVGESGYVCAGDGCFNVNFLKDAQLSFLFQITGDLEQKPLFLKIKEKFNLGTIQQEGSNTLKFKITGKNQLRETLIP